jgi:hypothetical protein
MVTTVVRIVNTPIIRARTAVVPSARETTPSVDDVRLNSHALTQSEVTALFSPVPEPTSFAMFGIALLGMARRRRSKLK